MAAITEYRKPNMTNMPEDVGKVIFAQILNTPAPDDEELDKKAKALEKKMLEARKKEND